MRIINDVKLDFNSVLLVPKRSTLKSRSEVNLVRKYTFKHSQQQYQGIPVVASNMDTVATFAMANELANFQLSTALHKHYAAVLLAAFFSNPNNHVPVFYSLGVNDTDYEKFKRVMHTLTNDAVQYVCIDVANGYSEQFVSFVKRFREKYPNVTIMAGNVVTPEMTEELIMSGVDIVKVGIGSGSVCTTRKMTGVGYPQLSAVLECADAAHGLGGHICSDGGCTLPADVAKAFAAGADFVMLGGMLAGHEECGGKRRGYKVRYLYSDVDIVNVANANNSDYHVVVIRGKEYVLQKNSAELLLQALKPELYPLSFEKAKNNFPELIKIEGGDVQFYGMSSQPAQDTWNGGLAEYRASEGKEVYVPYRGPVKDTVQQILGGLRSACTYTGARELKELSKRATFIRVAQTHNTVFGD